MVAEWASIEIPFCGLHKQMDVEVTHRLFWQLIYTVEYLFTLFGFLQILCFKVGLKCI